LLLKDFTPSLSVNDFVQLYRIVHLVFDKNDNVPFKAYPPRPEQCLAFYPFDTEKVKYATNGRLVQGLSSVLYGQFTEVTQRYIGHQFLVFQVIFYPGALFRLTGISSAEITNEYMDAELVFSSRLREVNEKLFHAPSYPAMIGIVEDFLLDLIQKQKKEKRPIDVACKYMFQNEGKHSVEQLSKEACLSMRQFERNFKDRVGVNPKLYERIARFDRAFRLKNSLPSLDWLRIAVECGYHDYQHLAKEYKDFTGLSPIAFHQLEDKAPERTFGLSEKYYYKKEEMPS
jgi:AraC-like DNA-binding protein